MCISLLWRVTFPKAATAAVAYTSDLTDISALLGSISGIANLQVSFREGLPEASSLRARSSPVCSTAVRACHAGV
jgi:hypothetical protein